MISTRALAVVAALCLVATSSSRHALADAADPIELVESKPVETMLDTPGIRATRDVWLEMIGSARRTLDIAVFYVAHRPGMALEPIIRAIEHAARRCVSVRVLADRSFQKLYPETLARLAAQRRIAVRYVPLSSFTGGIMHAKYFIVDRRETFIGSQNFDWKALTHIHEIGVRIREPRIAASLQAVFDIDWQIAEQAASGRTVASGAYRGLIDRPSGVVTAASPVRIVWGNEPAVVHPAFSPSILDASDMDREIDQLVAAIDGARRELMVQMMEYSPVEGREFWPVLDDALRRAAVRGVKVRLLVSDWAAKRWAVPFLISLSVIPGIEIRMSTLPPWSGGFINYARVEHCKYLVVDDDLAFVGTGNWEKGYFTTSRNVSLFVHGRRMARQLEHVFLRSWLSPYARKVEPGGRYQLPRKERPGGL